MSVGGAAFKSAWGMVILANPHARFGHSSWRSCQPAQGSGRYGLGKSIFSA